LNRRPIAFCKGVRDVPKRRRERKRSRAEGREDGAYWIPEERRWRTGVEGR
jgi:hypothetical protein